MYGEGTAAATGSGVAVGGISTLASTGASAAWPLIAGMLLLLAGVLLVRSSRYRPRVFGQADHKDS